MLVLPNGDRFWPTIGESFFNTVTNKIIQHQLIQTMVNHIELHLKVSSELSIDEENNLLSLITKKINQAHINFQIMYVDSFPMVKFEAFKCLI